MSTLYIIYIDIYSKNLYTYLEYVYEYMYMNIQTRGAVTKCMSDKYIINIYIYSMYIYTYLEYVYEYTNTRHSHFHSIYI